ncbi:probable cysteine--tRNA ligase, mitochondrial isoform X1 [Halyomorpha halys]|uniref:probable cysteine--tRNA ligase, mitochondrial isoform X1 n=1 Tax=Halyomorpha halys TaxID=286706 RepID=UPI0006D50C91|nr:probable cysteine--tRNA ligase, mitochondrial [Halyomorpha halys]
MIIRSVCSSCSIKCSDLLKYKFKGYLLNVSTNSMSSGHLFSTSTAEKSYKTGLTVYDSGLKKKVELCTVLPKTVLWYCCGPTVYDSAHLGHACSFMHFDIMRRIMENYFGLNVVMVMNITDIDDKIITKANELQQPYKSVSRHYEKEFFEDMQNLNILPPSITARVTENIPEILDFIKGIMNASLAYSSSDGSIYFNISKYPGYGKFSQTQESQSNPLAKLRNEDFALWKSAKPGEPFWDSPWGKGRPGWHIECSTIACKYLGHSIDIHSGGIDLKFPHHENEEAQCCARFGISKWVSYWIHTGHLFSKGTEKMSKSLKNTVSIREFLNSYTANVLRIFCLLIPYRNGVELRKETLERAVSIERKISQFLIGLQSILRGEKKINFDEQLLFKVFHETEHNIIESFRDDFDTNKALSELLHLISTTNSMIRSSNEEVSAKSLYCLAAIFNFISSTLKNLGYNYLDKKDISAEGFEDLITSAIKFRTEIREAALDINKFQSKELLEKKKYLLKACDTMRADFLNFGIELKDQGKTTTWSYTEGKFNSTIKT